MSNLAAPMTNEELISDLRHLRSLVAVYPAALTEAIVRLEAQQWKPLNLSDKGKLQIIWMGSHYQFAEFNNNIECWITRCGRILHSPEFVLAISLPPRE